MRRIEKRGAVNVLCDDDGNGCMPATRAEIEFFDEIERLRAEVEALRADNKHLRGEFEKAWPDAERYRWLREYAGRGAAGSIFDNFSGTAIDECIDAARAAREGRG